MDFIERISGLSPDGGDGSTELLWVVAVFAVVGILGLWKRMRQKESM